MELQKLNSELTKNLKQNNVHIENNKNIDNNVIIDISDVNKHLIDKNKRDCCDEQCICVCCAIVIFVMIIAVGVIIHSMQ